MKQLAPFAQRNGTRLVHVHPANGIAHQPACRSRRRNPVRGIRGLLRRSLLIAKQPTDDAAQKSQTPGKDQQPEQKSHDASKKVHLI